MELSTVVPPLFGVERQHLLDLLGRLDEPDWRRPTPCPGWTVLDLCCHLLGGDLSLLARQRDGHHGTPSPDGLGEPQFIEWLDDLQIEWVHAARRLSSRLVADLLAWTGPQVVDALAAQDPDERTGRVSWAGPDPVPVRLDHVRELSERWIHRQQLLEAVGEPSDLDPIVLGPVLDGLRWAYPYRLDQVGGNVGDTVEITVSGPVEARWLVVATDSGWAFASTAGRRLVARLALSTDEAWRLLTNNLSPARQAELDVSGGGQVVEALLRTRAIIGTPE
jgi:uncharacterized protein (TIGR03083 family)